MADIPSPPAKTTVRRYAPGQVSWLSDRPTPRAFPAVRASGFLAGFLPDHSDGVAADSHRLPWALTGARALRQCTLTELGGPVQASRGDSCAAQRSAVRPGSPRDVCGKCRGATAARRRAPSQSSPWDMLDR